MTLSSDSEFVKPQIKYKLEPPEGGWGYVVMIFLAVMFIVTLGPSVAFGIIYGEYLSTIGDEASATATINGILNTCLRFMGLVTNRLLQKYSCRFVGIIGSLLFFLGNFLTIFASSVGQMIVTFGILQGVGFGLMLPAMYVACNKYFVRRKSFAMSVAQTLAAAVSMAIPYFAKILMDEFGYRGTIAILAAISLHSFVAVLTLQPVEWHMIKVPVTALEVPFVPVKNDKTEEECIENNQDNDNKYLSDVNEKSSCCDSNKLWNTIYNFLELSLMKDPKFVNIAVGISLSFMSDVMFLSLLPMFLSHMNYSPGEIAYLMTVLMAADLIGRILLTFLNSAFKMKNRFLFLIGSAITAVFRIVFTIGPGDWIGTLILITLLGLVRCLIQIPIPLVIAEYSQSKFSAAFGLYFTLSGIISLISGQLSSIVASMTIGDTWIQHLLTLHLILCVIPWTVEIMYIKWKK